MNNRPRDPMPSFETHLIAAAEAAAAVPVKEPAPTAHAKLTA